MDLVSLLIVVLVLGVVLYLIRMLPIDEPFKTVALVVVIVIFLIYLLRLLPGTGL